MLPVERLPRVRCGRTPCSQPTQPTVSPLNFGAFGVKGSVIIHVFLEFDGVRVSSMLKDKAYRGLCEKLGFAAQGLGLGAQGLGLFPGFLELGDCQNQAHQDSSFSLFCVEV